MCPTDKNLIEFTDDLFYHPWAEYLAIEGAQIGLDVGCGTGYRTDAFRKLMRIYNKQAEMLGCDITPEMVELASKCDQSKGKDPITAKVADVRNLPYDSNTFDVVTIMYMTFSHLPREDASVALRSIKKVLKPRGKLLMDVPMFTKNNKLLKYFMAKKLAEMGRLDKEEAEKIGSDGIDLPYYWKDLLNTQRYFIYSRGNGGTKLNSLYLYGDGLETNENELITMMRGEGFDIAGTTIDHGVSMKALGFREKQSGMPPEGIIFHPENKKNHHTVIALSATKS